MNAGPNRLLYIKQLINAGACREQVEAFRERFGKYVEVTPELCASVAAVFDWWWAARNLLSPAARAEYERVRAAAWAEYERVTAPVLDEYKRVTASARTEYKRARASAFGVAYNLHAWGAGALV
jgi:hypothetical protein